MGCGDSRKEVENQIMIKKLERIDIQMERFKNLKLLEEIVGYKSKIIPIPDYIEPKCTEMRDGSETPLIKGGTEFDIKNKKRTRKRIKKRKKRRRKKKDKNIEKDNNNNIEKDKDVEKDNNIEKDNNVEKDNNNNNVVDDANIN